jgi:serine/threonine protein kinase/WD40 repeat protein
MALKPGTQLGPYQITAPLGAGGMGEVYRATDAKLKREVAIKVLPDDVAGDGERLARFEREARVLASLNHPHIASIYGLEESGGVPCLVLELVEGQTLAERLAAGVSPVKKALEVAKQIASALEAAHQKGVVHRDLKPANVKITPEGVAKVLDFGLAKAFADEPAEASEDASLSPTLTISATRAGVILGTAAYMSPEQARGKPIDKRTDIWAFACVLYEMLTRRQAFPGETASDSIAGILERTPDWQVLPDSTPLRIRDLLDRCLRKDRRHRLHDVADARIEIEDVLADLDGTSTLASARPQFVTSKKRASSWRAALLLAAGIAVGAAGIALWKAERRDRTEVTRVSIVSSEPIETTSPLVVSPRGRSISYVTAAKDDEGAATWRIVTRSLDRFDETRVNGTISAVASPSGRDLKQNLTYSPDGRWLAFIGPVSPDSAERRLYKTAADGSGPAVALADLPANVLSILWIDAETILGATHAPPSILEFPSQGGEASAPRPIDSVEPLHHYFRPTSVLPGGRYLLAAVDSYVEKGWQVNVALLDRKTGALRSLIQGENPVWSPTGHILFTRIDQLLAVRFDLDARNVVGGAVPVTAGVRPNLRWVDALFGLGPQGTLAYLPGELVAFQNRIALVDRNGEVEPWSEETRIFNLQEGPALSPDGQWIKFNVIDWERGIIGIWVSDFETRQLRSFAVLPGMDCEHSAWSPDSRTLAYNCRGGEDNAVFVKRIDGSGEASVLFSATSPAETIRPTSFSSDGSILLVDRETPDGIRVDALRLGENVESVPLLAGPASRSASYSPDNRWIAYAADESGTMQVYVRSIAADLTLGPSRIVSSSGGRVPVWSPSREGDAFALFYDSGEGLMEVRIATAPTLSISKPQRVLGPFDRGYPTPDGRFVFLQGSQTAPHQINLVFNFFEELERLVPAD